MSVGTPVVGVVGLKAQSTVLGGVSESSRNEGVCCVCNGMYVCNAVRRRKPYGQGGRRR